MTPALFPELVLDAPATEGVKYAGSKLRILPYILRMARNVEAKSVFDGFSGTTRVSQAFAKLGYKVISNDISAWSKTFGLCYLKNKRGQKFYQEIIEHLNDLPPKDGWFSEHYGGVLNGKISSDADGFKKPFQIHNTRKLDAVRDEIDNLNLDEIEKSVLLTALILALDKVDSTLGHYASYLSEWSPRSFQTLHLKVPQLFASIEENEVLRGDIFQNLETVETDLAYFDPPYGSNNEKMPPSRVRYAAYYHLWTSICVHDKPQVFGKAKRRVDTSDVLANSVFEEFRKGASGKFIAVEAIEKLLKLTKAKFVILSYSSGGRATAEELESILGSAGKIIEIIKVDYRQNVMAAMRWTNDWIREVEKNNQEYLFLIEKK